MFLEKLEIYCLCIYSLCSLVICSESNNVLESHSEKDHTSFYLPKYLFYDVNPPEGFNLRRDVYMRLAVFMKSLESSDVTENWHLVLPPWSHLYHWKSVKNIGIQSQIPWSTFFDVGSMKRYTHIVEMYELFNEIKDFTLDVAVILQNYKDAFSEKWSWEDKWDFDECNEKNSQNYFKEGGLFGGYFWGFNNITTKDMFCISFQGQASKVKEILDSIDRRLVMIDHAEIILHDWFGNAEYWRCRRSMRFASHLTAEADKFRQEFLDSSDESDRTVKPIKWEDEVINRTAIGGNYLSVHLRRHDFELSRNDEIPTLDQALKQISDKLEELKLNKVFVATDAPNSFFEALRKKLIKYDVIKYNADLESKKLFKDGGLAIIDQIICSHARYFIGSHESTFSFRIQEEREILGFPVESTFNRFCGSVTPCSQPTKWLIKH